MKSLNVMIVGCLAIVVSGCNITLLVTGEPGSGVSASEDREVGDFDEISLAGSGQIQIVCGQEPSLQVTTDDNLLEFIETRVSGDKLIISNTQSIRPSIGPDYEITTENLNHLSIYGGGKIEVLDFEGTDLDFEIAGSGEITVIGRADSVSLDIAGSGDADLTQLEARDVSISISGSGQAKVNASENLKVSIAGSGDIKYIGDPKISKSIAGSGSVAQMRAKKVSKKTDNDSLEADESSAENDKSTDDEDETQDEDDESD